MAKIHTIKKMLLEDFCNRHCDCNKAIPPERILTERYKVSRYALREAIALLTAEGYLERRQGAGTFVRKLAGGRNPIIGVIFLQIGTIDTTYTRTLKMLEAFFAEHGYSIMLGIHNNDPDCLKRQIERFVKLKVSGCVLHPLALSNMEADNLNAIRMLTDNGIPFVLTDCTISPMTNTRFSCVSANNYWAMYHLVRNLVERGYTRIAHIRGLNISSVEERFNGYCEALNDSGIPIRPEYIKYLADEDSHRPQGSELARELIQLPEPPQVITCFHDFAAYNVVTYLRASGFAVPEQIGVTGFDHLDVPGMPKDFLTTLEQPVERIAQKIVDVIIQKIKQTLNGEVQIKYDCTFIPGMSVAPRAY